MRNLFFSMTVVLAASCGGDDTESGGDSENRTACIASIEAFNALPCVDDSREEDPEQSCPDYDDACDMTDYFACLAEGWQCVDVGGVEVPVQANDCEVPDCQVIAP